LFVQKAGEEVRKYAPQFVINSDQSGIQRMMPSKTTLETKGIQKVLARITNESGLTHFYTIQTAMSMEKLLPKIYVVCQESNEGAKNG
jgi:histidinol phosphatase-like enzyme